MLLKLLKYDFRAMWKSFSLIWGAALALALVNRFTLLRRFGENILINPDLFTLGIISVIMAMLVITIRFVIRRFSKGLLGDEGYLMHTLPVRSWQLVLSKLICGAATWIISGVVAIASPFLMAPIDWSVLTAFRFWQDIFQGLSRHPDVLALILEFCLVALSAIILAIAVIYLAVSISHLFAHRKRLISVASFIGLYILLFNIYDRVFSADPVRWLLDVTTSNVHGSMLTAIAVMLLPAAAFLAAVCWILEHKLNLE